MPSFDIESRVDLHELTNAIDQSNRVIANRYDFKEANASFEFANEIVKLNANEAFQIDQMIPILKENLAKRGIDLKALDFEKVEPIGGQMLRQNVGIRNGIDKEKAKKITKSIKESKLKVQAQIQDDAIRVSSKSRDALQDCMSHIKSGDFELPLQFENMRN